MSQRELELLIHRVLAQHESGEVCTECPEWSVLLIAYGVTHSDERTVV
jgi:hypothetical protein